VSNYNNTPKSASHMLYHELAANGGTSTNTDEEIFRNRAELLTKALKERDEQLERCGQMIAELRSQRDAARRDFCNASYDDPHLVARERGWDCFKEEADANNELFRRSHKM